MLAMFGVLEAVVVAMVVAAGVETTVVAGAETTVVAGVAAGVVASRSGDNGGRSGGDSGGRSGSRSGDNRSGGRSSGKWHCSATLSDFSQSGHGLLRAPRCSTDCHLGVLGSRLSRPAHVELLLMAVSSLASLRVSITQVASFR